MNKKWAACLVFGLCFIAYSTALAEKVVSDNFNDSYLVFKNFADDRNYYDIYSPNGFETSGVKIDVKKMVYAKTPYLKVEPEIVDQGPLNQEWVFSYGSSVMWRDVHWKHDSGIIYDFDQEIKALRGLV